MSKLVKRGCIVLLVGTVLSVTMGVQGAKADQLDDIVNDCNAKDESIGLTPEEFQFCQNAIRNQQIRDNNIENRNEQLDIYRQGLQNQVDIIDMGANPIIPQPTDFGVGNNNDE